MKNRKIMIVAGAGAVLLLCLAGFFSAYNAYAKASKVEATLKGTYQQLQGIYNEDPFPCITNMNVFRGDAAWLVNWHQSLVQELQSISMPSNNPSSSIFIAKLQESGEQLHKLAKTENGKMLPDGFAFGFERYLPKGYPAPENVKRLSQQFFMVEAITREILGARVTELSQIERERFDGGEAEPVSASHRRNRSTALAAPKATPTADNVYAREHFTFSFSTDEKGLDEVLNRLARMPLFVVVTEVRVDRVERGLRPKSEKSTVEADKTVSRLQPLQRLVSGSGIAPLLKTKLQVDVYTFEGV